MQPAPLTISYEKIPGCHHVRRAVEVALAGKHSIAFVGHQGSLAPAFSNALIRGAPGRCVTLWAPACPCGNSNDPKRKCYCPPHLIADQRAKFMAYDIVVEVTDPDIREFFSKVEVDTFEAVLARADGAHENLGDTRPGIPQECKELLEEAYGNALLRPSEVKRVLVVSRTIAALDGREAIEPAHLMEAIQHRCPSLGKIPDHEEDYRTNIARLLEVLQEFRRHGIKT